jgi:hypothetical protein
MFGQDPYCMFHRVPSRERIAKRRLLATFCLLATYLAVTAIGLDDILAEDKSTSITCTGEGPCEKTECTNGDCKTTATNSSNITSVHGPEDVNKDKDTRKSIIEDRLSQRGH